MEPALQTYQRKSGYQFPSRCKDFRRKDFIRRPTISENVCLCLGLGLILAQINRQAASGEGEVERGFVVENSNEGFLNSQFHWEKTNFRSAHLFWITLPELDRALNSQMISECYIHQVIRRAEGGFRKQRTLWRIGPGEYRIFKN